MRRRALAAVRPPVTDGPADPRFLRAILELKRRRAAWLEWPSLAARNVEVVAWIAACVHERSQRHDAQPFVTFPDFYVFLYRSKVLQLGHAPNSTTVSLLMETARHVWNTRALLPDVTRPATADGWADADERERAV